MNIIELNSEEDDSVDISFTPLIIKYIRTGKPIPMQISKILEA